MLMLWQYDFENPSPPVVCPTVEKLVIYQPPRHPSGPDFDVSNWVRYIAMSRRKDGTTLTTVTLCFQEVERLSQACRGQMRELALRPAELVGLNVPSRTSDWKMDFWFVKGSEVRI